MSVEHVLKYTWSPSSGGTPSLPATVRQSGSNEQNLSKSFAGGSSNVSQPWAVTKATLQSFYLIASQPCTVKTNSPGVNAVISVSMAGTPTGGTFEMTGTRPDTGAITTATAIPYNATVSQFQTACDTVYGSGNTVVTGGPFPGTAFTVTFQGVLAAYPVTLPTFNNAGLTGGTSPAASASTTTAGVRWGNKWDLPANIPVQWHKDDPAFTNPLTADIATVYVTVAGTVASIVNGRALVN